MKAIANTVLHAVSVGFNVFLVLALISTLIIIAAWSFIWSLLSAL